MTEQLIKLSLEDIPIGQPLPWPIYDKNSTFLVKKGFILQSESQVERLLMHGAFGLLSEMQSAQEASEEPKTDVKTADFSPFDLLDTTTSLLEAVLKQSDKTDFVDKIWQLTDNIQRACARDSHASLASLFLLKYGTYSIKHSLDVAVLCELLGRSKGFDTDQRRSLIAAALTMNIAMIDLQETLYHQQAALSEEQKKAILNHPKESFKSLAKMGVKDELWLKCVLTHHERIDGGGYPNRLKGSQYPEQVQLIVLADQYCARLSPRAYRQPILHKGILRDIILDKGLTVSQEIAALFVKELGFYPPGLVVRLNCGEIGIVTKRGEKADTPVVHVCIKPRVGKLSHPVKRNTTLDAYKIKELLKDDDPDAEFDKLSVWGY